MLRCCLEAAVGEEVVPPMMKLEVEAVEVVAALH